MNKNVIKLIACLLIMAMMFSVLAACNKKSESLFVPPEFVFVPEIIPLPDELGNNLGSLALSNDKLFLTSYNYTEGTAENNFVNLSFSELFSMNLDGSNFAKLPGYTPPATFGPGESGGFNISNIIIDLDGNLWVYENWYKGRYDLPDTFDPEVESFWEYEYQDLGSGSCLRKLSPTGAELFTVDLADIIGDREWYYVYTLNIDIDGNIYLATENNNYEVFGMEIHVLDSDANKLFVVESDRWINQLIKMPDGRMAFESNKYDDATQTNTRSMVTIDLASRSLGEEFALPEIQNFYGQVLPGSGKFDILLSDYNRIYGYSFGEEEAELILNWLDTDVSINNLQNINMVSEDKIICTNYVYNRVDYSGYPELLIMTRVPYSELPERTVLTLATFDTYYVRDAVVEFNKSNTEYRIQILDYSQYNTEDDWNAGVTRLSTELISGRVPDILCLSSWRVNYKEYVAKGLLADLYPFIDSDPQLSRDNFVNNVFPAAEIDGSLYQVFSSFTVNSLVGPPEIVGTEMGWNMDEFTAVLNAHPQADMPLGQWLTKTNFLQAAISYAIDDYINWGAGTAHFDSPHFIQLLEFCNTFPDDIDYENIDYNTFVWISDEEAIATGRQIMAQTTVYDFTSIIWTKQMFGGNITYKGFPTENRNGNSLSVDTGYAIIDTSPNKDAAWQFVRTILDGDWQLQNAWWGFPTNKAAFDVKAQDAFNTDFGYMPVRSSIDGGVIVEENSNKFTQADLDQIISLIGVASGTAGWNMDQTIWEIISEEASDYFNGSVSAAEAARDIQSRLTIFVSERS